MSVTGFGVRRRSAGTLRPLGLRTDREGCQPLSSSGAGPAPLAFPDPRRGTRDVLSEGDSGRRPTGGNGVPTRPRAPVPAGGAEASGRYSGRAVVIVSSTRGTARSAGRPLARDASAPASGAARRSGAASARPRAGAGSPFWPGNRSVGPANESLGPDARFAGILQSLPVAVSTDDRRRATGSGPESGSSRPGTSPAIPLGPLGGRGRTTSSVPDRGVRQPARSAPPSRGSRGRSWRERRRSWRECGGSPPEPPLPPEPPFGPLLPGPGSLPGRLDADPGR